MATIHFLWEGGTRIQIKRYSRPSTFCLGGEGDRSPSPPPRPPASLFDATDLDCDLDSGTVDADCDPECH